MCIRIDLLCLRQYQVLVFFVYRVRFFAGDRDWIPSWNLRGKRMSNTTSWRIKYLHFDLVRKSFFVPETMKPPRKLKMLKTWQSLRHVPLSLASDILHFLFAFSTSRRAAKLIGDMPEEFRLFMFFWNFLRCYLSTIYPIFYLVFPFHCIVYLWLHLSEKLRKPAWSAPCSELTKPTHL